MGKPVKVSSSSTGKLGIAKSSDGLSYAIDWTELPASDHYFLATHCEVRRGASQVKFLFGSVSSFDESAERYDSAVEIHFPLKEAYLYLYHSVFEALSGNGKSSIYDAAKKTLEEGEQVYGVTSSDSERSSFKLPENRSTSFRLFPANFAAMAYAGTQGLIEFFEVPPDLVHLYIRNNRLRPGAGVKPVISILMDTNTLIRCMEQCREILEGLDFGGLNGSK